MDENLFRPGMRVEITNPPGQVYEVVANPSRQLPDGRHVDLKSVPADGWVIPVRTDQIRSLERE